MMLLILGTIFPAMAADLFKLEGVDLIDGDTVAFKVLNLPYNVAIVNRKIRDNSYDTWESRLVQRSTGPEVTDEEIAKGKLAKEAFNNLLKDGDLFVMPPVKEPKFDSFGRLLGKLYIKQKDGVILDVGKYMKENGHTRPTN